MSREVFGVEAEVFADPQTGSPLVMPLALSEAALRIADTDVEEIPHVAVHHAFSDKAVHT